MARRQQTHVESDEFLDELADDGRLGIIAKRLAIENGADWPSLDGDAQDAWHERAIELIRSGAAPQYLNDLEVHHAC